MPADTSTQTETASPRAEAASGWLRRHGVDADSGQVAELLAVIDAAAVSPFDMTIHELQSEIGRMQSALHWRICGDPRDAVIVNVSPVLPGLGLLPGVIGTGTAAAAPPA